MTVTVAVKKFLKLWIVTSLYFLRKVVRALKNKKLRCTYPHMAKIALKRNLLYQFLCKVILRTLTQMITFYIHYVYTKTQFKTNRTFSFNSKMNKNNRLLQKHGKQFLGPRISKTCFGKIVKSARFILKGIPRDRLQFRSRSCFRISWYIEILFGVSHLTKNNAFQVIFWFDTP